MVKSIAIIPARGGSKRIPRKNIKDFLGEPIMGRTIRKLINSQLFENIIVSTDDEEIADVARSYGALVPFLRPRKLSDDITPTAPVISHTLRSLKLRDEICFCCCVYPCNPLLTVENLVRAKRILVSKNARFVYPICRYPHPVQRRLIRDENGVMSFAEPENELTPTQNFSDFFHDTGQFYWGTINAWISGAKMHTSGLGMVIPSWQVVDIDTTEDWVRAELIYSAFKSQIGDQN